MTAAEIIEKAIVESSAQDDDLPHDGERVLRGWVLVAEWMLTDQRSMTSVISAVDQSAAMSRGLCQYGTDYDTFYEKPD